MPSGAVFVAAVLAGMVYLGGVAAVHEVKKVAPKVGHGIVHLVTLGKK